MSEPATLERPLLIAPPSSDDSVKLDVENESAKFKLDTLGPMVINTDGTLSRIANWVNMTPEEQARTLRVLSARNKIRLADQQKREQNTSESTEAQ
ncbi:hypothetical protein E4T56_gene10567 [Termitomyces sp. T112]|nr:hypothetical protein E4T56_gene10567 [Termitomyces sp. T112]KAH0579886.1 hypothetical protein H2248_002712 [Termitomyces sp. 'cryptogamus']